MYKCEKCNKYYEVGYSKRFCSKSCASSYSSQFVNHNKLKVGYCKKCGKEIQIKQCASINACYCKNCKSTMRQKYTNNQFLKQHLLQIKTLVKYFGFNEQCKESEEETIKEFNRVRNLLDDLYWNQHWTSQMICDKFNYPRCSNLTNKVFKYLNIPVKTFSESQHDVLLNNRSNKLKIKTVYKHGWYTTWDNKQVYLRSSYEFDYAKELDNKQIKYNVECFNIEYYDSQQQKLRIAIPDFYIKESNTIVEIKSDYTYNKQNMIDKFNQYKKLGYNVKLILNHQDLGDITL